MAGNPVPEGKELFQEPELQLAEASEAESPADFIHKLKLAQKELKESRVWLLFASRLSPGEAVEGLRSESRELLLMIGKSINTATARIQGKTIEA